MITRHLTDEEIQEYVSDGRYGEPAFAAHIQQCEACKSRVASYQQLFERIREQPEPVFDFNLQELVLAKLNKPQARFRHENIPGLLALMAVIIITGSFIYVFREKLALLVQGILPYAMYLIITTIAGTLIILCLDLYKSYRKKMNVLDYY